MMTFPLLTSHPAPRLRSFAPVLAGLALLTLPLIGCDQKPAAQAPAPTAAAATPANPNDKVVAKVNGVDIRESDIAIAEDDLGQEIQQIPPDQRRDQVLAYLSDIIMVAKAPDSAKMADTPEFKQRIELTRNKLVMGLQLQAIGKAALTEEAMKEVYNTAVKSMGDEEEVRARHILVATQEEANEIVRQLREDKADFAALAKEKSKDPGAADGGDLGFFGKDQMVPEFSEVAFKMYEGQISNPVKSQFGWHVIKLEEKRKKPVPEFDKVKDQIQTYLSRKAQTEYVAKLRETGKVERLDKPAEAPAAKK